MDAARWKKFVAQCEEVLDLLSSLPDDLADPLRERVTEIMKKTKKRRQAPGKRDGAVVDNAEYFALSLIEATKVMRVNDA